MNIILNTQTLQSTLTGIGWYTRNLLQGLQKHKIINQLICIPSLKESNQIIKKIIFQTNLKKIIKFFPGTYSLLSRYRSTQFIKKTRFLVHDKYIYHEPCYILSPYLGPKICTIHDLSHIHYPEYHPKERVKYLRYNLPISINNADHIITGSDFVRNELINLFSLSPNKITRIYHGVSNVFRPRQFHEIKKTILAYNLHEKSYLLSVGTLEPRKNLEHLIQAFSRLPEKQRKKYPLVLVGIKGWNTRCFEKLTRSLIKKEQLYCLGYVPEADLPYLYSGAYGFIYISIYEGFGLPLLEAMASGIPTLASSESAMPEVVGDAAMPVNPFEIDLIADKLNQLINDLTLRDRLKQLGPLQAAKFSWKSCIEDTLAVYRQTLNSLGIS
ncbi:glycosyltransferase family 1 protein [Rickettsiella endosymbiont of Miltochrista miniata]|uniref:glycosyltransferase family 4 protein n=1 Tax=Rickettsiella endosymbiont of Miltochrista miniata TaxID=3066239 RepID=UPI00313A8D28